MDRYRLAREFDYTVHKDNINRLTEPAELKEVALGLLQLNYGLREYVSEILQNEMPAMDWPPKS